MSYQSRIIFSFITALILLIMFLSCKEDDQSNLTDSTFQEIPDSTIQGVPEINEIVSAVNLDTLKNFVRCLSGDKSVKVDGIDQLIETRYAELPGNETAARYISSTLWRYGYLYDIYNPYGNCKDIIAVKKGTTYSDTYIVIGAHYDDMPRIGLAPGADDNASGVSVVLEAARIFSRCQTKYSIIFALWDGEETSTPSGSLCYATMLKDNETKILETLNIDMIGWDSDNDGAVMVYRTNQNETININNTIDSINRIYSLNLRPNFMNTTCLSDDRSFALNGFNTINFIEKFLNSFSDPDNDFNPYWHKNNDTIDKFNESYFYRCSKLVIATLAYLSVVE